MDAAIISFTQLYFSTFLVGSSQQIRAEHKNYENQAV